MIDVEALEPYQPFDQRIQVSLKLLLTELHFFLHSNSKDKFEQYKLKKSVDGVLGTRTRGAGWKAQTNPRSYGGTPQHFNFVI